MADTALYGYGLEGALSLAGMALLGFGFNRRWGARAEDPPQALAPWPGVASDFLLYLLFPLLGAMIFPSLLDLALKKTSLGADDRQVWENLAFEVGIILGIMIFHRVHARFRSPAISPPIGAARSGAITFLVTLPIAFATMFLWRGILAVLGFKAREQDVVDLFQNLHTPGMKILFVFLAVVAAPCAEELIFRAGIFRFLRRRLPRGWAVLISALLFGAMHLLQSPLDGLASLMPLVAVGAVWALAYERTGRIGTSMIAHALFNLNTLITLLLGMSS